MDSRYTKIRYGIFVISVLIVIGAYLLIKLRPDVISEQTFRLILYITVIASCFSQYYLYKKIKRSE